MPEWAVFEIKSDLVTCIVKLFNTSLYVALVAFANFLAIPHLWTTLSSQRQYLLNINSDSKKPSSYLYCDFGNFLWLFNGQVRLFQCKVSGFPRLDVHKVGNLLQIVLHNVYSLQHKAGSEVDEVNQSPGRLSGHHDNELFQIAGTGLVLGFVSRQTFPKLFDFLEEFLGISGQLESERRKSRLVIV